MLWEEETQKYDCVFVDGSHWFPVAFSDILWGYFNVNDIVVFHDVCKDINRKQRTFVRNGTDVLESLECLDSAIKEEVYIVSSGDRLVGDIGVIIKEMV